MKNIYSEIIGYIGNILLFITLVLIVIFSTGVSEKYQNVIYYTPILYLTGEILIVISIVGLKKIYSKPKYSFILIILYTILSLWDFISIIIFIPFMFIYMILVPLMTIAFILSIVTLVLYTIENIINYDLEGIHVVLTTNEFFGVISVLIISFIILFWNFSEHDEEDWILAFSTKFSNTIRTSIEKTAKNIENKIKRGK